MSTSRRYYVFYSYSPSYNDEQVLYTRIEWKWLTPPETWDDYEQVRVHLKKKHGGTHLMLYMVIPVEEYRTCRGTKNFSYKNGKRKPKIKKPEIEKPWEDHAEADR